MTAQTLKYTAFFLFISIQSRGQLNINVVGNYNSVTKTLKVTQEIEYTNNSDDTLEVIYLHDWNNSYSSRDTQLAKRFEEEFISSFHYANSSDYGHTEINLWTEANGDVLQYERPADKADVWKITLNQPLRSGETLKFIVDYNFVLPNSKFIAYGQDDKGNVYLKNWLLWPAVYYNGWMLQSNKNLDDLYAPKAKVVLQISSDVRYTCILI